MKNDDQEITLLESDITSNKDLKKNNFKTTKEKRKKLTVQTKKFRNNADFRKDS